MVNHIQITNGNHKTAALQGELVSRVFFPWHDSP